RRIGHERWLRNVAVACGNALRQAGVDSKVLQTALAVRLDASIALVVEHVQWALAQSSVTAQDSTQTAS
ncbi:MAG: hypothetical protein KAY82_04595, partial [Hylemonella sp.]|nr:hypothetical protein [Hylemonella sp.]